MITMTALFRSWSKLRALVPDIQSTTRCSFTKTEGFVLLRRHITLQHGAPLASPATQKCFSAHGAPDRRPWPHGTHALATAASWEPFFWCRPSLGRGWDADNQRRTLQTCSRLNAGGELSQRSRAGVKDGDEGTKELEAAERGGREGVARGAGEGAAEDDRPEEEEEEDPLVAKYDETGKPLSNWMRMKMMMKTYGYVIIPVHWVIAPVWFGAFYYTVKMGVDISPFLLKVGVSQHHVDSLQNSGASNALMAYALYKIATPLRYTLTLGATEMTIRYLRRKGYIRPPPRKEKTYRQSLKETVQEVKDRMDNR